MSSNRRLRILFIFPQLPYPPESGGRIVTFEIVKYLLPRHDIWIASLLHRPEDNDSVKALQDLGAKVLAVPAPPRISLGSFLRSVLSDEPYKAHRFFSPELSNLVQETCAAEKIDLIHAQNFYMAQYVSGSEDCARVYYKENFEGLLVKRYAETLRNPLARFFWLMESRKTARFEAELGKRFNHCFCISPVDAQGLLERAPEIFWDVLPASMDTAHHKYMRRESSPPSALFLGILNYFPNVDAAEYFAKSIWPLVRKRLPDAEFHLCGHSPTARVKKLAACPGVRVIGSIEDARDALERCAVFVVPLRIGGGVRLKILQALATGCAVVSTSIGCEGLDLDNGRHLLIADDPETFAESIIKTLSDSELRRELGVEGRKRVEELYSPGVVLAKLEAVYQELCGASVVK